MRRILIVDDDEPSRFFLEELFKSQHFETVSASNGAQALEAAREAPPDVIISDILMPVMDGFSLCHEWKKDASLKNIPFIFYTATYTDPRDEKLAFDLGADRFITKPQDLTDLLFVVQDVLEGGQQTKTARKFPEEDLQKQYSQALFRKLEKKIKVILETTDAIQKSEIKYRSIFQNSLSGIFQISREGKFLISNPAFHQMLGYDSLEDLNNSIQDIGKQLYVDQSDHQRLVSLLKQKNIIKGYETKIYRKDGRIMWINSNIWPVRDKHGRILHYEGIIEDITDRIQKEENLKAHAEKLKNAVLGTINIITTIVEQRDPYTAGHQRRVSEISMSIAKEMGFSDEKIEGIKFAGSIHDLGKIAIPAEILNKPSRLSEIERRMVEYHVEAGYNILKRTDFPWPILNAVAQHHERMDGSGYPAKLLKEQINMDARILAVADVVEAMSSHRPYRPACGTQAALEEIEGHEGVLYDAEVTKACLSLFKNKSYCIPP